MCPLLRSFWLILTAFPLLAQPAPDSASAAVAAQRTFALATKPDGTWANPGRARRGEKIFADPDGPIAGICATCHKVTGYGGDIGPDLSLIGGIYRRADLIASIQEPSKTIAYGFDQVSVQTVRGEVFVGALRQQSAERITVKGADGQPHVIPTSQIQSRTTIPTSLMPPGLTIPLEPEQFADLVAYLESLR